MEVVEGNVWPNVTPTSRHVGGDGTDTWLLGLLPFLLQEASFPRALFPRALCGAVGVL